MKTLVRIMIMHLRLYLQRQPDLDWLAAYKPCYPPLSWQGSLERSGLSLYNESLNGSHGLASAHLLVCPVKSLLSDSEEEFLETQLSAKPKTYLQVSVNENVPDVAKATKEVRSLSAYLLRCGQGAAWDADNDQPLLFERQRSFWTRLLGRR